MGTDRPRASRPSTGPLRQLLREDLATHRSLLSPGLHCLAAYRVGHWALARQTAGQRVVWKLYRLLEGALIRNLYGTEIVATARIGRRVRIGHHQSVLIAHCDIGDDCLVRHGLTLGVVHDTATEVPTIGRGVHIGANVTVVGDCVVGDGAVLGPHSLVMTDVPCGARTFANPARVLRES